LIKVSKNADSSLVSNENVSEILPSNGWAQVRYQQPKMAKNLPRAPMQYWKYWKSIEFQNPFSRPWKSIEFGQNVH